MSRIVDHAARRPAWQLALAAAALLGAGLLAGYFLFGGGDPAHDHAATGADPSATANSAAATYTCSMHPQIIRDEPGDCPICGMDLIPMGAASDDPTVLEMTEAAVAMARVQTSPVVTLAELEAGGAGVGGDEGADALAVSGRLAVDETRAATQSAHVAGRVERLLVGFEGERVRAGQVIAELYAPELVTAQRELLEAARLAATSPETGAALLEAARTRLHNLRIGEDVIDAVLASGQTRERFPVRADVGGVVVDKRVEVGDYVRAGEALYTLTDLSRLYAEFDVFEDQLARIREGDRLTFTTPADPGRTYRALVSFVDPLIDPATRTATVRAEVGNAGGRLKPEMLIRGQLFLRGAPAAASGEGGGGALAVPASAVLWTGERSVVYVEVPDASVPAYAFREVELGERVGAAYLVREGLAAGERVVTRGAFAVDASAQLNNKASMMNRDVRAAGLATTGGETAVVVPDYRGGTPEAFRRQLGAAARAYLPLKDALVAGDVAAARAGVSGFGESLAAVDMALLTDGDAHAYWMQLLGALRSHADAVAAATDLDEMRRQFAFLSTALISAAEALGLAAETPLYVEHCPMALDNAGADWLSDRPIIRNPYFGDAMLTCGSVLDTLPPL